MNCPLLRRFAVAVLLAACLQAFGQSASAIESAAVPDSGARSSILNAPGHPYPMVDSQSRAIFQFYAPGAHEVLGDIVAHRYPLTRQADGMWTGTTDPLPLGFHYYAIVVDGVRVNDPGTQTFFGVSMWMSGLEVPDPDGGFYQFANVPHGTVRIQPYYSSIEKAMRRSFIYTPPGYEQSSQRYPVLYLQHGAGEDESGWSNQGRVNLIMDNLIAAGKAKPMIIVMENGGGSALFAGAAAPRRAMVMGAARTRPSASAPASNASPRPASPRSLPAGPPPFLRNQFEPILLNEVIPMIDASYRTIADRDHRAMAGLSMGGAQTMYIGMSHLDTFSAFGVFSGVFGVGDLKSAYNGVFANAESFNQRVRTFYFSVGTTENVDGPRALHKALQDQGIHHVYFESQGTAHEWQTWRRSFNGFAPLLFKTE